MKTLTLSFIAASLIAVIAHTEDKVVKIGIVATVDDKTRSGVCSGALISSDGLVLTCAHCFGHGDIKKVFIKRHSGEVYAGTLLIKDVDSDLALVKIEGKGFPYFQMGTETVKGQQVIAFGSPLGIQRTVSVGYVENLLDEGYLFIIHGAAVNPGNSGGPLVDLSGKLVGINQAMIMANPFVPANGLYVAISVDTIERFMRWAK